MRQETRVGAYRRALRKFPFMKETRSSAGRTFASLRMQAWSGAEQPGIRASIEQSGHSDCDANARTFGRARCLAGTQGFAPVVIDYASLVT